MNSTQESSCRFSSSREPTNTQNNRFSKTIMATKIIKATTTLRYVLRLTTELHVVDQSNNYFNKKLSYCWETVRRESMPRIAEMDVEMTT